MSVPPYSDISAVHDSPVMDVGMGFRMRAAGSHPVRKASSIDINASGGNFFQDEWIFLMKSRFEKQIDKILICSYDNSVWKH